MQITVNVHISDESVSRHDLNLQRRRGDRIASLRVQKSPRKLKVKLEGLQWIWCEIGLMVRLE